MPLSVLLASIFIIDRNSLTRYLSQYLLPVYNTYNRHSTGYQQLFKKVIHTLLLLLNTFPVVYSAFIHRIC